MKWRFKGHAESAFWKWVCSWARACRKPSDLGFEDDGFILPALTEREHVVETRTAAPGMLFALPASNMWEEREERRRTLSERCEMAAQLVADTKQPAVVWCHLNAEGERLASLIKDGREVSGASSDDEKEEAYEAFASGQLRVLVIKPKIGAWGLNWQHCAHVVTFASHSYEQYYQAVRRCWRFGQKRQVVVDLVATEGERGVKDNLRRKSEAADRMFTELVAHMNDAMRLDRGARYEKQVGVPAWL
jgi:superfamily II DNA or RNA helicase